MPLVRQWYDGFTFGQIKDIYNPWSILNFLKTGKLDTYWANTSEKAIWSLLLASGYLKICQVIASETFLENWQELYELKITNYEVRIMFQNMIREWFASVDSDCNDFINSLLAGNVEGMNIYINQIAMATFSFFDTGGNQPEKFYHGFVLGLVVDLAGRYVITSNRESGFGRYDIMLEPVQSCDDAMIIEFKVRRPDHEKTLQETVDNALAQIEEKHYDARFISKGISRERIRKYGFAFDGKQVLIG